MAKYSKTRRFKTLNKPVINNSNLIRDSAMNDKLFRKVVRLVGQTNKRIKQINNTYGSNSWATKKLKNRLSIPQLSTFKQGRIKVSPNMSDIELRAVINAINIFNQSKTSSVKGIKSVIKNQKSNIKDLLSNNDVDISDNEAENLYSFFEDSDFNNVTQYIPPSDIWVLLQDAKDSNMSIKQFKKNMSYYINSSNDDDMNRAISNIYNKYVVE